MAHKLQRCQGMHRFLLVEEWTGMGATCSCLLCESTFHMAENVLERFYLPFRHFSGSEGPKGDKELLVHMKEFK